MEYKKIIINGYILGVAKVEKGNISKEEYDMITEAVHNKPAATSGFEYRLRTDLTWEKYELSSAFDADELTDTEALNIILGGDGK